MELRMEHIVPEDYLNVSRDTIRVCRLRRLKQGANVEDFTCRCSAVAHDTTNAMSNQFTFVVEPRNFYSGGAMKTNLAMKSSRPAGLYQ